MQESNIFLPIELILKDMPAIGYDVFKMVQALHEKYGYKEEEAAALLVEWYFSQNLHTACLTACSYYCAILGVSDQLFTAVQNYYEEYIETSRKTYEHNCEVLRKYSWFQGDCLPDKKDLQEVLIYQDQAKMIYLEIDTGNMRTSNKDQFTELIPADKIVFAAGFSHMDALMQVKSNLQSTIILFSKRPMYVYYESEHDFINVLQTADITSLIEDDNVVFFSSLDQAKTFLLDTQSHIINHSVFGTLLPVRASYDLNNALKNLAQEKDRKFRIQYAEIRQWYKQNENVVRGNIRGGKPRILFITSMDTTAAQYHTRDCIQMCDKLGCITCLRIEKSVIHTVYNYTSVDMIHAFRPDIIFCIDWFRSQEMPQEIIHVCWAQDPMDKFFDQEVIKSLDKNQFTLSPYAKETLKECGYNLEKVLYTPLLVNHEIYKPMDRLCQTDIILVGHTEGTIDSVLENARLKLQNIPNNVLEHVLGIFKKFYQVMYEQPLYSVDEFREYLSDQLQQRYTSVSTEVFERVLKYFSIDLHHWFFHMILAEWLIDGGYTNLKLYGNGWESNPKFQPYAMGPAENGEKLAEIYETAKITLATNVAVSGIARFYECYASGGFYIAKHIDASIEMSDFKGLIQADVPTFYDKEDLYEQLDYYLGHDEERRRISAMVRQEILQKATYEGAMKQMLEWLSKNME